MIESFANIIPEELLEKSGSVFYSGRNAFKPKKKLYILGLNPGGSVMEQKSETVRWHTNEILNNKGSNFSEYSDSSWRSKDPGTHGLQPRVLHLIESLSLNPYEIPSSNVCFLRSSTEADISKTLNELMELCWPFHRKVINALGIKMVLCFGKTCGNFVRKKLEANILFDEHVETNNRNWKSTAHINKDGFVVVSATHPSRANWKNKDSDISNMVKRIYKSL